MSVSYDSRVPGRKLQISNSGHAVRPHQPAAYAAKPVRLPYRLPCDPIYMECGLVLILGAYRVNEEVIIRLKWGQTEYKGRLVSIDSYMNIQLSGAEEWIDQQMTSALGQVLIRYV